MKPIIVVKNCKYHGRYLQKNEKIKPTKENLEMIKILNTGGFVCPLFSNDIKEIENFVQKRNREDD